MADETVNEKIKSRVGPLAVAPVVHGNISYSVGERRQTSNWYQMGYVEARDAATRDLLWEILVYEVEYEPGKETDVQEIYITALRIVDGALEVTNEHNDRYRIDLTDRSVRRVR